MKYPTISQKIITLKERDLALRDKLMQAGQLNDGYNEEMAALHNSNAEQLNEIIEAIGYPTVGKVGKGGSEAAWLIIQHAIGRPVFMKKCAHLLAEAVNKKEASPTKLAYLTDRIAVFEGQAQLYGTQFDWDEKGEMAPQLFDDLNKVNERRKSIGLHTLQEQTEVMKQRIKSENQLPPIDLEKRKREFEEWRKLVGWIK